MCVRTACLLVTLLAGLAAPARAQAPAATTPATTDTFPTYEVSLGYQLVHIPDETLPFGLSLDGAFNVTETFGLVGEIGWAIGDESIADGLEDVDVDLHSWSFGAGPRWNARPGGNVWPFAQVLIGGVHARSELDTDVLDVETSDTRFMIQPGVGVNFIAGDGWGIVGQVDYRRVFLDEEEFGESGQNEFRVFIGGRMLLD
jgi:hypothetical protein